MSRWVGLAFPWNVSRRRAENTAVGGCESEKVMLVGPIALKWNSDETLPMNCDVSLTTDILIYDSCGKEGDWRKCGWDVDNADSREGAAVHTGDVHGMDVDGEVVPSL